ncbi:MAG TPA: YbaY family lipoprotein [Rhodanobacteraceae bacterium]|nr:YbaY family lipoprotein [Rhodanobacteraceae bacterium]
MRKSVVAPLLIVPLILAGCGSQSPEAESSASAPVSAPASAATPATAATAVSGTVNLQDAATVLQPGATLQLSLVDVSKQPGVTVNQQNVAAPKFPQSFSIPFTAGQINPNDLYVLQATMQANGRTWTTPMQQPVLTHNQPATVNLTLIPQPTRAEKMMAAFQDAKRATGGMKVTQGSSSKIGEARSWQVFRDANGVEFIIEQVNHNDTGFTKTEYAYRNGLPWVVVQEALTSPTAAPTSTTRVAWGDDGVLVVNEQVQGSNTTTVSDATTKTLHRDAETQYKRFSKQH